MNTRQQFLSILVLCLFAMPGLTQDDQRERVVNQQNRGHNVLQGQDVFIKITIALKQKAWRKLTVYHTTSPSYFSCDYPDFMLGLIEAYQRTGQKTQAWDVYLDAVSNCSDRAFLAKVYQMNGLNHEEKKSLFKAGMNQDANRTFIEQLQLDYLLQATTKAIADNDGVALESLDPDTMVAVRERQDINSTAMIAWKYLDAGKNRDALRWFAQVEKWGGLDDNMRQGRELARRRAQDISGTTSRREEIKVEPPPVTQDTGKSRAELFKEKELWDMIGEGRYEEARAEIYNFRSIMPSWKVPPKMQKILEEQAYRQKIAREEQLLWRLLEREEFQLLDEQIKRVKRAYPKWEPPAEMVRIKDDRLITAKIDKAIMDKDWDTLHKLHNDHAQYFNCSRIDYMWAHAEMHVERMEWSEARKAYADVIGNCEPQYQEPTLQKAIVQLPEQETERFLDQLMATNAAPDFLEQLLDARYRLDLKRLSDAIDAQDLAKAGSMSVLLEDEIRKRQDPEGALALAWTDYNREAYESAIDWFKQARSWGASSDESDSGIILTHYNSGDKETALEVLKDIEDRGEKVREASSIVYSTMCWDLYEKEEYEEVLDILEELKNYGELSRTEKILEAWSLNGIGQRHDASEIFEELYLAKADKATASGLIATTPDSQLSRLRRIAEVQPGPLDDMLGPEIGKALYESKRYLEVNKHFPGMYRKVRNIDKPSIMQAFVYRNKKGIAGPGEFRLTQIPVFAGELILGKTHQIRGGISRVSLESGELEVGKALGNFPSDPRLATTWNFSPTDSLDGGFSTWFDYRWHNSFSPHISLESTPSDGVFDPVLTWNADISGSGALSFWKVGAFSRPIKESILSYTGMIDPYLGAAWGQVIRTGFEAVAVKEMEEWGIHLSVNASNLEGERVADNEQAGGTLSLIWETDTRRFDTLSFGSRLYYDSFDNNQHHFTYGHGGYFSPKQFVQVGGIMHLQTKEARNYVVAGDVELGFQEHTQEVAPLFPLLSSSARFYPEEQTDGMVYLVNFRGVYRMTRSWQLGAEIMQRKTALYSDTALAAHLRFVFGKRRHLFSSDLRPGLLERVF